jgi:hypothetical protein
VTFAGGAGCCFFLEKKDILEDRELKKDDMMNKETSRARDDKDEGHLEMCVFKFALPCQKNMVAIYTINYAHST